MLYPFGGLAMASTTYNLLSLSKALPSSSRSSSFCGTKLGFSLDSMSFPAARAEPLRALAMKRDLQMEELRKMSNEELKDNVVELKGELLILRMKRVARQNVKTHEFQKMRKRIARMLTIHRERELEQGIKKRESRKLDKVWKRNIVVKPPPSLVEILNKKKEEK